jgi:threonine dehydrogenase-like Zn-dependent dehydrogenase
MHRVIAPAGALPQAAERLDADPTLRHPDEIHIAVDTLNVDSASFRQFVEGEGGDAAARGLGVLDAVVEASATDPAACALAALAAGRTDGFDLVVSCVNVPGAELAAILATRERGRVYFFSMATTFARAALGAEGVARDIDMLIGNGYCVGHAEATLALVRSEPALKAELLRRFA